MNPTVFVEDWAPYSYLIKALLKVKPLGQVRIRPYDEVDHALNRDSDATSTFVAYQDAHEATFSFLAVAEALDRQFNDVLLCGDTASLRAVIRSACQIIDEGHLMLAASQLVDFPGYSGPRWHDGSRAPEAMLETYFKKLAIMERLAVGPGSFLLGERPYLPDVIVAACSWYAHDIGLPAIPEELPTLTAWYDYACIKGPFGISPK